jgi:flagellin-like hook-associated protein FlgL
MGAISNRLNHSISFSENELLNIGDSESTIRDTDVALAATALTRAQILTQHSTGMLAQSLNAGRNLLQLI